TPLATRFAASLPPTLPSPMKPTRMDCLRYAARARRDRAPPGCRTRIRPGTNDDRIVTCRWTWKRLRPCAKAPSARLTRRAFGIAREYVVAGWPIGPGVLGIGTTANSAASVPAGMGRAVLHEE